MTHSPEGYFPDYQRIQEPLDESLAADLSGAAVLVRAIDQAHAQDRRDFPAIFETHDRNSRASMLATAREGRKGATTNKTTSALILGPLYDIPLDELALDFGEVTVAHSNLLPIKAAITQLPSYVRRKGNIHVIEADVTGIMDDITAAVDLSARCGVRGIDSFARHLNGVLPYIKPKGRSPDVGSGYDFVCSSGVLSSLLLLPESYIQSMVEDRYGPQEPSCGINLQDVITAMGEEHIAFMANSVSPTGTIYFADRSVEDVQLSNGERMQRPVIPPPWINPLFAKKFGSTYRNSDLFRGWDVAGTLNQPAHTITPYSLIAKP